MNKQIQAQPPANTRVAEVVLTFTDGMIVTIQPDNIQSVTVRDGIDKPGLYIRLDLFAPYERIMPK